MKQTAASISCPAPAQIEHKACGKAAFRPRDPSHHVGDLFGFEEATHGDLGLARINVPQLKLESPSLNIEWQTSLMNEMPNQILSKKVDLSIAALPVVHDHLHSQAFMRGRMVVVMAGDHPLAQQPVLSLQQLEGQPLLLFRPDMPFGQLLAQQIEHRGLHLHSLLSFTNAVEAVALVKQGMGLSIIDEFVAQDSGLTVVPLAEEIYFDISFVYSRFEPPSQAALHLMRVLRAQAVNVGRAIAGFELPNP